MKRFHRWLFNGLTAASLVICLVTLTLWVWSYWRFVDFGKSTTFSSSAVFTHRVIRLGSNDGRYLFSWRDLNWLWSHPATANVSKRLEATNGAYFTLGKPIDLFPNIPRQPGSRSWEKACAGCHFTRLGGSIEPSCSINGMVIIVPHAYVCATFAVLPTIVILKKRRTRRAKLQGLCPSCGYDLRATPDRCPECGSTPSAT
jgi:hypothetical protein